MKPVWVKMMVHLEEFENNLTIRTCLTTVCPRGQRSINKKKFIKKKTAFAFFMSLLTSFMLIITFPEFRKVSDSFARWFLISSFSG